MKQHLIALAVSTALGLGSNSFARDDDREEAHAVFVMTNAVHPNEILRTDGYPVEFSNRADISERGDISVLRVNGDRLKLGDTVPSGGALR